MRSNARYVRASDKGVQRVSLHWLNAVWTPLGSIENTGQDFKLFSSPSDGQSIGRWKLNHFLGEEQVDVPDFRDLLQSTDEVVASVLIAELT